jgi:hypothetical protein
MLFSTAYITSDMTVLAAATEHTRELRKSKYCPKEVAILMFTKKAQP